MTLSKKKDLTKINNDFYQHHAFSFSQTRQRHWPGWEKLPLGRARKILDLASGNLRFKRYLDSEGIKYEQYLGVDNCLPLLLASGEVEKYWQYLDICLLMQNGESWWQKLKLKTVDFILVAGFMHHLPEPVWREQLLADCAKLLAPGGILAVSFWEFIHQKTAPNLLIEYLGDNDYLLSWQGKKERPRYCHNFTDKEIADLRKKAPLWQLKEIAYYRSDGKLGKDNHYLVWQKQD